jgi:hypothetical protein
MTQTTVPPSSRTRRALLAGAALVAPASLLPAIAAAAAPGPDPLVALERAGDRLNTWGDLPEDAPADHPRVRDHHARWLAILGAIAHTPARGAAGLAVKVRALALEHECGETVHYAALRDGLLADLERLAGEARHA